jgi:hypothetical protein
MRFKGNTISSSSLLRSALTSMMLLVSIFMLSASAALAGGKDCSGSFTVTLSDGRIFTGGQGTSVPLSGGMTAQVRGKFVEFTVNLNDFTVTNYTLTSDITGGGRTVVFARKQPLHGKILTSNLSINLNNEQLVLQRSGPGINMKIQAKDCSEGGLFQMEPDQTIEIQHELGPGFVYCVDSLDRVLIVNASNPLIARESPETATLAVPSPKSAIKGTTVSKWLVQGGGRMGLVTGEDAVQPLPLNQSPCAASTTPTPTPSPTPNASPTPSPSPTPSASPTPTPSPANSTVQFSMEKFKAPEGSGSVTITVTRTGSTASTQTVDYSIGADDDGSDTALQRTDFNFTAGTLAFAPSETAKTFTVLINQNGRVDGEREARLLLSNPKGGAALGTPSAAKLEIEDDDFAENENPLDDHRNFVRQHYHDFLNREPEDGGLNFWANKLEDCHGDAACLDRERTNVSAAFYISKEFQNTGFFVFKLEKASFNRRPAYKSFMPGVQEISRNMLTTTVEDSRRKFADDWANSAEFHAHYDSLGNDDFVNELYRNAERTPDDATRNRQVDDLNNHRQGRGAILKEVVEDKVFNDRQYNAGFVLMQYFGYLRRDPDEAGYQFWLKKLNGETQVERDNYQSMVRAFVIAREYRERFGQ